MFRSTIVILLALLAIRVSAAEPQVITIKTVKGKMLYDVTDFTVRPGADVKIVFENQDDMPHNLTIFQPGTDVIAVAAKVMENPDEALKRDYLPTDPRMLAHSKAVQPKTKDEFTFKAPEKPGVYPYVCTFPAHAQMMNGKMRVVPGLTALKFALYLGSWNKLPDFAAMKPFREGDIPDQLVQIKLDDYKNHFGLVFSGRLDAPKDGDYTFSLAGDDGVRLLIDGKKVVEHDGIHGANEIREGKVKLNAGGHDMRLEYFQGEGEAEVYLGWRGPGFTNTALSKWVHPDAAVGGKRVVKKKAGKTGMPLVVGNEPIVYRNFIANAGGRPIGVGYPGGFSLAWSAAQMNLALLWRGGFIDAALHWTDRGGGEQPPLGDDQVRPTGEVSVPFAILSSTGAEWPKMDKRQLAPGYNWKGYTLDKKRYPTFFYEWGGVKVSDRFDTEGLAANGGKFIRTLRLKGPIPANAYLRVAAGTLQPLGNGFSVDGNLNVAVTGAIVGGSNLLVSARPEIKITYSWPDTDAQLIH